MPNARLFFKRCPRCKHWVSKERRECEFCYCRPWQWRQEPRLLLLALLLFFVVVVVIPNAIK
jgi:hypothetical protein